MGDSTFDNAMIRQALKDMSPEQLDAYQKIGNSMHKTINFATNQVLNNIDPPTEEKLAYIDSGLKSGLLPKDLERAELEILTEVYGERWFEKYGYTLEDIGEMAKEIVVEAQEFKKCGRNQKCPCKSGKKFKVCHGAGGKTYKNKAKLPKVVDGMIDNARETLSQSVSHSKKEKYYKD